MAARCAYCSSELKPNSMYCNSCGQLAAQPARPAAPVAPSPVAPPPPVQPVYQPPRDATLPPIAPPAYSLPPAVVPPVVVEERGILSRFEIKLSTGEHYAVDGTALLGRKPEPAPGVEALPIDDTTKSVSRAHVRLQAGNGVLFVTDLGSANGTSLSRGGVLTPCLPNREVPLQAGDEVWIGDVSFRVFLGGPS